MPRKRSSENKGLPPRWRFKHGAYYYRVPAGVQHLWAGKSEFRLGKTLHEAYKCFADRVEIDEGDIITLADGFDRYAIEVVPTKAPKTQTGNISAIKRLKAVFGEMRPIDFKPMHAYGYRDRRKKANGEKAPTVANRELEVLSHLFTKLIEWGVVSNHPMIEGKFKKAKTQSRARYVEDWEITEILSLSSSKKYGTVKMIQAYVALKLLTGMRRTDMLSLKTADVSEEGIYNQPSKTKNSSGKETIYEWDDGGVLKAVYEKCLAVRPVFASTHVFCTKKGQPYFNELDGEARGFDSAWARFMDRVMKETNITDRFQERDLRAKCATDAKSLEHARTLLGHTSATTTMIYRRKADRVTPVITKNTNNDLGEKA